MHVSEAKAGKSGIAARCPNCRYAFEVTEDMTREDLIRRQDRAIDRKLGKIVRRWIIENWKMRLEPETRLGSGLVSRSLGRIYLSGISPGMKHVMAMCRRFDHPAHVIFAMGYGSSTGDSYVCIPAARLLDVVRGMCNDSAELAERVHMAWKSSAKGTCRLPLVVADGGEHLGPAFDDATAFPV